MSNLCQILNEFLLFREVSLHSSRNFTIDRNNFSGIRIGMSQLVADMLESLLHICRIKLPPDFVSVHFAPYFKIIFIFLWHIRNYICLVFGLYWEKTARDIHEKQVRRGIIEQHRNVQPRLLDFKTGCHR